jgi:hypothetical protein
LTDGDVGYSSSYVIDECNALGKQHFGPKIFTFGIGSGCDKGVVASMAFAGSGTHAIIEDGNPKELKVKVVQALKNSSEPFM